LLFSRVYLAKKKRTGDYYAIKVLKKLDMVRKNMIDQVIAERDILASTQNPFVVSLINIFQLTHQRLRSFMRFSLMYVDTVGYHLCVIGQLVFSDGILYWWRCWQLTEEFAMFWYDDKEQLVSNSV
jgi:serine/threonine protein kinase